MPRSPGDDDPDDPLFLLDKERGNSKRKTRLTEKVYQEYHDSLQIKEYIRITSAHAAAQLQAQLKEKNKDSQQMGNDQEDVKPDIASLKKNGNVNQANTSPPKNPNRSKSTDNSKAVPLPDGTALPTTEEQLLKAREIKQEIGESLSLPNPKPQVERPVASSSTQRQRQPVNTSPPKNPNRSKSTDNSKAVPLPDGNALPTTEKQLLVAREIKQEIGENLSILKPRAERSVASSSTQRQRQPVVAKPPNNKTSPKSVNDFRKNSAPVIVKPPRSQNSSRPGHVLSSSLDKMLDNITIKDKVGEHLSRNKNVEPVVAKPQRNQTSSRPGHVVSLELDKLLDDATMNVEPVVARSSNYRTSANSVRNSMAPPTTQQLLEPQQIKKRIADSRSLPMSQEVASAQRHSMVKLEPVPTNPPSSNFVDNHMEIPLPDGEQTLCHLETPSTISEDDQPTTVQQLLEARMIKMEIAETHSTIGYVQPVDAFQKPNLTFSNFVDYNMAIPLPDGEQIIYHLETHNNISEDDQPTTVQQLYDARLVKEEIGESLAILQVQRHSLVNQKGTDHEILDQNIAPMAPTPIVIKNDGLPLAEQQEQKPSQEVQNHAVNDVKILNTDEAPPPVKSSNCLIRPLPAEFFVKTEPNEENNNDRRGPDSRRRSQSTAQKGSSGRVPPKTGVQRLEPPPKPPPIPSIPKSEFQRPPGQGQISQASSRRQSDPQERPKSSTVERSRLSAPSTDSRSVSATDRRSSMLTPQRPAQPIPNLEIPTIKKEQLSQRNDQGLKPSGQSNSSETPARTEGQSATNNSTAPNGSQSIPQSVAQQLLKPSEVVEGKAESVLASGVPTALCGINAPTQSTNVPRKTRWSSPDKKKSTEEVGKQPLTSSSNVSRTETVTSPAQAKPFGEKLFGVKVDVDTKTLSPEKEREDSDRNFAREKSTAQEKSQPVPQSVLIQSLKPSEVVKDKAEPVPADLCGNPPTQATAVSRKTRWSTPAEPSKVFRYEIDTPPAQAKPFGGKMFGIDVGVDPKRFFYEKVEEDSEENFVQAAPVSKERSSSIRIVSPTKRNSQTAFKDPVEKLTENERKGILSPPIAPVQHPQVDTQKRTTTSMKAGQSSRKSVTFEDEIKSYSDAKKARSGSEVPTAQVTGVSRNADVKTKSELDARRARASSEVPTAQFTSAAREAHDKTKSYSDARRARASSVAPTNQVTAASRETDDKTKSYSDAKRARESSELPTAQVTAPSTKADDKTKSYLYARRSRASSVAPTDQVTAASRVTDDKTKSYWDARRARADSVAPTAQTAGVSREVDNTIKSYSDAKRARASSVAPTDQVTGVSRKADDKTKAYLDAKRSRASSEVPTAQVTATSRDADDKIKSYSDAKRARAGSEVPTAAAASKEAFTSSIIGNVQSPEKTELSEKNTEGLSSKKTDSDSESKTSTSPSEDDSRFKIPVVPARVLGNKAKDMFNYEEEMKKVASKEAEADDEFVIDISCYGSIVLGPLPGVETMEAVDNAQKISSPTRTAMEDADLADEQNLPRGKGPRTPPLPAEIPENMETFDNKFMSSKPNERKRSHEERSDVDQAAKKFKFSDEAIAAAEWAEFVQLFLDILWWFGGYDEEIERKYISDLPSIVEINCLGLMKKEDYVRELMKGMKQTLKIFELLRS
ncbi:hypothetical protein CRE_05927 [Caenorhabditis remanei]|uniref:Uncharacterized protein n=1 Tax=Caenorhabditis remanei TaxID=31234 RepID=E3MZB4_CAERE|nr:hypothetical protein CRE_05927 [Caenorhabditis remanei]